MGCTSFGADAVAGGRACGHTERRCPRCGRGVVRREGGEGVCTEPECKARVPLCRCEVPKPMAVRTNRATGEEFWGCQDWRGAADPGCGATQAMEEEADRGEAA